jgi:hypothetical protein
MFSDACLTQVRLMSGRQGDGAAAGIAWSPAWSPGVVLKGLGDQRLDGKDGGMIASGKGSPVAERFPTEPDRVSALASWP